MDTVQLRHHDIKNQKMHFFLLQNLQCLKAVIGLQDTVTLLCQIDINRFYNIFVVITYQDCLHDISFPPVLFCQTVNFYNLFFRQLAAVRRNRTAGSRNRKLSNRVIFFRSNAKFLHGHRHSQ